MIGRQHEEQIIVQRILQSGVHRVTRNVMEGGNVHKCSLIRRVGDQKGGKMYGKSTHKRGWVSMEGVMIEYLCTFP